MSDWTLLPAAGAPHRPKRRRRRPKRSRNDWRILPDAGLTPAQAAAQNKGIMPGNPNYPHGGAWPAPTPYVVGSGATGDSGYSSMSDTDMLAQANALADSQLGVQSSAIERMRQAALAAAQRDREAIAGLGDAQMKMLAPIGPEITAIRNQAGQAIAGYGAAYSGELQSQIQGEQAANAQIVASQVGDTAPGAPTIDPAAVHDAVYATGGEIPATQSTEIGAASGMAAAGMPAVVARGAQEDIMQRMAEAASEDADYRQQLIDLYAQRPGLVQDAMDRLYAVDQQKFGKYEAEQRLKLDQENLALQQQAEAFQEKQFGVTSKQDQQKLDQNQQSLDLRDAKQAADLAKAEKAGHQPDAALSKVYGYVVDSNGTPILDGAGNRIPVVQKPKDKAAAKQKQKQAAGAAAPGLHGKPVAAPPWNPGMPGKQNEHGKYKTRPGVKGGFPDGTTNDPNKALWDGMSPNQAIVYLMQTYGISRADARKIVAAVWGL
jgi:hypothetical protein